MCVSHKMFAIIPLCDKFSLPSSVFLIAVGTTILVWSLSMIIVSPFLITDILSTPSPVYSVIVAFDTILMTSLAFLLYMVSATLWYPSSFLAASHISSRAGSSITSLQMSPLTHDTTLL